MKGVPPTIVWVGTWDVLWESMVPYTEWCPASCECPVLKPYLPDANGWWWIDLWSTSLAGCYSKVLGPEMHAEEIEFLCSNEFSKFMIQPRCCNTLMTNCTWDIATCGESALINQSSIYVWRCIPCNCTTGRRSLVNSLGEVASPNSRPVIWYIFLLTQNLRNFLTDWLISTWR